MGRALLAALAAAASAATATSAARVDEIAVTPPAAGSWSYSASADASEARFAAGAGVQLAIRCTRLTRIVSIIVPAAVPISSLFVWSSARSRSVPASFDPASGRASAQLAMLDPLLDGLALSRGRIAVTVPGGQPLVLPAWPEIARVVEDCRA